MIGDRAFDCEKALKLAKQLNERGGRQPFDGCARLCTSASLMLLNAISDLAGRGKELELPDSPGYWWEWEADRFNPKWIMRIVKQPLWVDTERHDLHFFYLDGSSGGPPAPGRWIRVAQPTS